MNLTAIEAKPFVPASDFGRAKEFYVAVGFEIPWFSEDLAYVRHGQTAFLLQAFNQPGFIQSFQMHLLVDSVDDWHAHLEARGIAERFGVRLGMPEDQPWAMRDFTLFDPSGVLWRIAQNLPRPGGINSSPNSTAVPSTDFLREMERSRIRALLARDMPLLWRLHAADYQLITPSGRSFSRDSYLSKIESGDLRYLRWDADTMEVRPSGQMAMVRYQATLELASTDGASNSLRCWHTDSYERTATGWQVVWSQATEIR